RLRARLAEISERRPASGFTSTAAVGPRRRGHGTARRGRVSGRGQHSTTPSAARCTRRARTAPAATRAAAAPGAIGERRDEAGAGALAANARARPGVDVDSRGVRSRAADARTRRDPDPLYST